MDYSYKAVIIGGGPAGVSCGITLQKNNYNNCIIDKKVFPRLKVCGGLVTEKTFSALTSLLSGSDISGMFVGSCDRVEMHNDGLLCETKVDTTFRFVERKNFDYELIKRYKALGGKLLEGENYTEIDFKNKTVKLSNGDVIHYEHLIAADGANSKTRRELGLKLDKIGFCVETHIPRNKFNADAVQIYFNTVKNGYGWVFPSGDNVCVGLGGVYDKNVDYKKLLGEFLNMLHIEHGCDYLGGFVPYGTVVNQDKSPGSVMLVGDAAGLVDPIYGEGLYFAITSGSMAAKAIIDSENNPKSEYLKNIAGFIEQIKAADRLQKRLFNKAGLAAFSKLIKGKSEFLKYYCEHQIARYDYSYKKPQRIALDYKKEKKNRK